MKAAVCPSCGSFDMTQRSSGEWYCHREQHLFRADVVEEAEMLEVVIATTESLPGATIERHVAHVVGVAARGRHALSDLGATLKSVVGGSIQAYAELLRETEREALERMRD